MSKANILVVEDESIVAKDIQQSLKKLGYHVVGVSATGEKAIELANEFKPDIVLMDIMLKGEMSGIDAAEVIRRTNNIPVIYLTAYADENTLSKAKVTEPYGYIIKPFKEIDIHTSIEMALYKHRKVSEIKKERDLLYSVLDKESNKDIIFVKANSKIVKLRTQDIYYVEALKDYVVINLANTRYTIHSTMKDIKKNLPANEFLSIEYPNLILENDKKIIPIGGSYKDDLIKRINLV
jgi:two-component system, LytTR family, response regulator LytT